MYRQSTILFLLLVTTSPFAGRLIAQPSIQYRPVISGLVNPVDIVSPGDGSNRLFIVQKEGLIKVYDSSFNFLSDFLSVTGITTQSERGLLSMAFHPQFPGNGFFFVYYTNAQGSIEVARYRVGNHPNSADPTSKTVIITIPHPGAANHNGGKLQFGKDGYLYFGTGDGGGGGDQSNNAQNPGLLLGKMIRIDIDQTTAVLNYRIPPGNPYINDATIADEIWAVGLRNPWRWSFDRLNQDMWIADVGQNAREEINVRKAGATGGVNYGWRCFEGKITYNAAGCLPPQNYVAPVFDYLHNNTTGGFSVTGGYVYRGLAYPFLNGYYVFADFVSGNQWLISDSSNVWIVKQQTGNFPPNITAFGENESGEVFASSLSGGIIYKLEALSGVNTQLLDFAGIVRNNIAELSWIATTETDLLRYEVESSTDSIHFARKTIVIAEHRPVNSSYHFEENIQGTSKIFYRLKLVNRNGNIDYSKTITLLNSSIPGLFVFPSVITDQTLHCIIAVPANELRLYSMTGLLMVKKDIRGATGRLDIAVGHLAKGIYFVQIATGAVISNQRIVIQ